MTAAPDTLDAPVLAPAPPAAPAADRAPGLRARLGGIPAPLLAAGRLAAGRWDALLAVVLALATGAVHSVGVFGFPSLADDEGTYVAQAAAVRAGELTHYTYWYDHPPLGWIQIGLLDWLPHLLFPGAHPVAASRLVMVLASSIGAALLYVLARRLGRRPRLRRTRGRARLRLAAVGRPAASGLPRQRRDAVGAARPGPRARPASPAGDARGRRCGLRRRRPDQGDLGPAPAGRPLDAAPLDGRPHPDVLGGRLGQRREPGPLLPAHRCAARGARARPRPRQPLGRGDVPDLQPQRHRRHVEPAQPQPARPRRLADLRQLDRRVRPGGDAGLPRRATAPPGGSGRRPAHVGGAQAERLPAGHVRHRRAALPGARRRRRRGGVVGPGLPARRRGWRAGSGRGRGPPG